MIKKIRYLRKLDRCTIDTIYYSLKRIEFQGESIVFEKGATSSLIYFVISGKVRFCMNIYDSTLQRMIKLRRNTVGIEIHRRSKHTLRRSHVAIKSQIRSEKLVQYELDLLGPGSIICGIGALFRCELSTHCVTASTTEIFILDVNTLDELAKENPMLKNAISTEKERYTHYLPMFDDVIILPPVIDYYRETKGIENSSYLLRKLKNMVLLVIIRNRHRIVKRAINCRALVSRIKAILLAKHNGMGEVAKMLEKNILPPKAAMLIRYLRPDEIRSAIYIQFAGLANRMTDAWFNVEIKNKAKEKKISQLDSDLQNLEILISEIDEIAKLFCRYA